MKKTGVDSICSWKVVAACFIIKFLSSGFTEVSGLFMEASITSYETTREKASLPYTLFYTIKNGAGPLVAYLGTVFEIRWVTLSGCILTSISIAACFFAESIAVLTVFYGGFFGLSFGLEKLLLNAIILDHFEKHIAKAIGISTAGIQFGIFFFSLVSESLINNFEVSGAFLVVSGIALNSLPAALVIIFNKPKSNIRNRTTITPLSSSNENENKLDGFSGIKKSKGFETNAEVLQINNKLGQLDVKLDIDNKFIASHYYHSELVQINSKLDTENELVEENNESPKSKDCTESVHGNFKLDKEYVLVEDNNRVTQSIDLRSDFMNENGTVDSKYALVEPYNDQQNFKECTKAVHINGNLETKNVLVDTNNEPSKSNIFRPDLIHINGKLVSEYVLVESNDGKPKSCDNTEIMQINGKLGIKSVLIKTNKKQSKSNDIKNELIHTSDKLDRASELAEADKKPSMPYEFRQINSKIDNETILVKANNALSTSGKSSNINIKLDYNSGNLNSKEYIREIDYPNRKHITANRDLNIPFKNSQLRKNNKQTSVNLLAFRKLNDSSEKDLSNTPEKTTKSENLSTKLILLRLFTAPAYILILISSGLCFHQMSTILIVLIDFAIDIGIEPSSTKYLLTLTAVSELFGSIFLGWIPDKGLVSGNWFAALCFAGECVSMFTLALCNHVALLVFSIVVFNLSLAGLNLIYPVLIFNLLEKPLQAPAIASIFVLVSPLSLTISPLIGYFRDKRGNYAGLFYVLAAAALIGIITHMLLLKLEKNQRNGSRKI